MCAAAGGKSKIIPERLKAWKGSGEYIILGIYYIHLLDRIIACRLCPGSSSYHWPPIVEAGFQFQTSLCGLAGLGQGFLCVSIIPSMYTFTNL
jgi:hypothetical protein